MDEKYYQHIIKKMEEDIQDIYDYCIDLLQNPLVSEEAKEQLRAYMISRYIFDNALDEIVDIITTEVNRILSSFLGD